MARIGISYQDVAAAAATIQGHQQIPTVDRIREILQTGSKTTIARHLKDWKIRTEQIGGCESLPAELTTMVRGLWERLLQEGEAKIAHFEQAANDEIEKTQQALGEEQKAHAALQQTRRQLDEQISKKKHEMQLLRADLESEKRNTTKLTERNSALSHQLDNQKSETDRLHHLLSHMQTTLDNYQTAMQKLREEQTIVSEKQRLAHERDMNAIKQKLITNDADRQALQQERNASKTELKLLSRQTEKQSSEIHDLQKQLQDKIIHLTRLQDQYDQHLHTADEMKKINVKITHELHEGEKKIAVFIEQIDRLNQNLKHAEDNVRVLHDEKLFLVKEKAQLEGQLKRVGKV